MIPLPGEAGRIFLSDEFGFCAVSATPFGRLPVNGGVIIPSHLLNMGIELIGEDAHDAVGQFCEAQRPKKPDHVGRKEEGKDVAPNNDAIKQKYLNLIFWEN